MATKKKTRKPKKREGVEVPGTDVVMQARAERHPDCPKSRPYVFDPKSVKEISVGVELGMNVALTGPTGCGKTTLPIALASLLGHPVIRFNCHGEAFGLPGPDHGS